MLVLLEAVRLGHFRLDVNLISEHGRGRPVLHWSHVQ